MILKYMAEPMASSSSDESFGEVDDEEVLHECLLSYETTMVSCCDRVLFPLIL